MHTGDLGAAYRMVAREIHLVSRFAMYRLGERFITGRASGAVRWFRQAAVEKLHRDCKQLLAFWNRAPKRSLQAHSSTPGKADERQPWPLQRAFPW
jgi:hypothetical protein